MFSPATEKMIRDSIMQLILAGIKEFTLKFSNGIIIELDDNQDYFVMKNVDDETVPSSVLYSGNDLDKAIEAIL